jgi:hypothetical protein
MSDEEKKVIRINVSGGDPELARLVRKWLKNSHWTEADTVRRELAVMCA